MSPSDGSVAAGPRAGPWARVAAWRLPPIETWPAAIALARTLAGKAVLVAVFAALMKIASLGMFIAEGGIWLVVTLAAAAISLAGRYRYLVLLMCTGALLVRAPDWFIYASVRLVIDQEGWYGAIHPWYLRAGTLIACVPLAALALYLARACRAHSLGRRPVLAQHLAFVGLLALASSRLLHGLPQVLLWSVLAVFSTYFWYLAYALLDQRRRQPAPMLYHFATFNTFAWSSLVPLGKGAANWRGVEAATADALAVTQLKAVKLLVWGIILKGLLWSYRKLVYGWIGVPELGRLFTDFLQGGAVPVPAGLYSVVANFPEQLLLLAVWGHLFVAVARLAGFRLLRNTCRPLSSRTIAEFWNRYYYYFKEVLVDVYFYPTYMRCFKGHPRLRMAFATFMAAGFGNWFLHFTFVSFQTIVLHGPVTALARSQTYAFYCLLLATGIVASQWRARRPESGAGWLRGRVLPCLWVWGFFCVLSVFDGPQRQEPLMQHLRFLYRVLGADRWMPGTG